MHEEVATLAARTEIFARDLYGSIISVKEDVVPRLIHDSQLLLQYKGNLEETELNIENIVHEMSELNDEIDEIKREVKLLESVMALIDDIMEYAYVPSTKKEEEYPWILGNNPSQSCDMLQGLVQYLWILCLV